MTRVISPESLEAKSSGDKGRLRSVALEYIRQHRERGATADEICAVLDEGHNSIAPRLTELKRSGLITELFDARGRRVRRKTRQGCAAGVVIASEFARREPALSGSLFGDGAPDRSYAE
jgi:hypothetical protein